MLSHFGNRATAILCSAAMVMALSACESNGTKRFSSVGQAGPAGPAGPKGATGASGPQGDRGPTGPQGPAGPSGNDGGDGSDGLPGLDGLNGLDALATGGLVGPGGVAGTGLLANTGDPDNVNPLLGGVLVAAGGTTQTVANTAAPLGGAVDNLVPGDTAIVGAVVATVDNVGQALVDAGKGDGFLVDGLVSAPGPVATVSLAGATVGGGDSSLIGASLLSAEQNQGQLLTVGVASDGQLLTLDTPVGGTGDSGLLGGVTDTVGGLTGGSVGGLTGGSGDGGSGGLVGGVTGTVGGVTGGLTGGAGDNSGLLGTGLLGH